MNQVCGHLIATNIQGIANAGNQEFFFTLAYLELLNKVCDLGVIFASRVFGWCVGIAESGLISAG